MLAKWPSARGTWQQFLQQLPGFYPMDVWDSLQRVGLPWSELHTTEAGIARRDFGDAFPTVLEHPLDFEWRFAAESVTDVVRKLKAVCPSTESASVGCFGCPSVAVAGEVEFPEWRWVLLDRRAGLFRSRVRNVELIECDLTREHPDGPELDAAVVDPPWYQPITKHFIARAQKFIKPGGVVLLSFPPEGTRAGAKGEMEEIVDWCSRGGLEVIEIDRGGLLYKTPFFESNSLKAAGFSARTPAWRRGDLIVFENRCAKGGALSYNEAVPQKFDGEWRRFCRDGLKFSVRMDRQHRNESENVGGPVVPVWSEQVLPTVSTSFPGREDANLVSSGNRFLRCDDLTSVTAILSRWERGLPIREDTKQDALSCEIAALIDAELHDKQNYLRQLYD